jgi:hypothetical protein
MPMREGDPGLDSPRRPGSGPDPAVADRDRQRPGSSTNGTGAGASGWVIETVISPFHCLYQDALHFHTQSHLWLPRSESAASRLARGALVLYLASAEALVHQAAVELGRPELAEIVADPNRPLSLTDSWKLLPAIISGGPAGAFDPETPPWPQFAELFALRMAWAYPGPPAARRAYYGSPRRDGDYEPLDPRQAPAGVAPLLDSLIYPRTGLPRDPYALRPRHLDTARSVLDAAIEALDRRLGGALTREQRHRREPIRLIEPASGSRP